jgi:hypothetical protein
MIGCAAVIGIVAFVIGLVATLIANDPAFPHPLIAGALTGATTFVAALVLMARDSTRHNTAMRTVRQMLLTRQDVKEDDFIVHFPNSDSALLTQTREAVSRFFDVPTQKVHPTDNLRKDLQFDVLEPNFHSFVVFEVLNARNVVPQSFSFNTGDLADIGDLANEIQRVLDGIGDSHAGPDDLQSGQPK